MVGAQATGACRAGGSGAAGGWAPLWGSGPVHPPAYRRDGAVSGYPGGSAHCGCGHLEADQTVRRLLCPVPGQPGTKGPGRVFPDGGHGLGPAGGTVLFRPVSGRPVYLRTRPGRDCAGSVGKGHCGTAVRRSGAGGGKSGREPPGFPAVPDGAGGESGAALAAAAALYPLPAHQRCPLRRPLRRSAADCWRRSGARLCRLDGPEMYGTL